MTCKQQFHVDLLAVSTVRLVQSMPPVSCVQSVTTAQRGQPPQHHALLGLTAIVLLMPMSLTVWTVILENTAMEQVD